MKNKVKNKFLLIASHPDSLINFRGPLIKSLLEKDLEVHVAAPDIFQDKKTLLQLEDLNVRVHEIALKRTGMNPLIDLKSLYQLYSLMQKIKPYYSIGYTHKPVIYGSIAAWIARVPKRFALITGLGYTFQSNVSWLKYLLCALYRIALANVNKVFFQNPDDQSLFYDLKIIKASDKKTVVVNGSGVDLNSFKPTPLPKTIQFLLIARLLGDKGVREYFQAASLVRQKYSEARFGLVGWIDKNPNAISQKELQNFIDAGDVKFYGRMEDVKPAISQSSIFVLPSYSEGTPRTVLEAMAMGRPIITTDAPGCRETVVNGHNGFLVPVKSVDELVTSMIKFIEDPELIVRMGRLSRILAEEKYDVKKVNKHMLEEMELY